MSRKLYQIYAPHFTAGFITSDTGLSIQDAAPILKWLRGKSLVFAADWCRSKGYTITPTPGSPDDREAPSLLPNVSPAALTDERILNAVGESHLLAIQGKSWQDAAQPIRALLAASPAAPAEDEAKPVAWRGVHVEGDYLYYDEFPKELSDEQRRQLQLAPLYAAQPPAAAEADKRDAERYRALRKAGDVSISCDHGDYTQYVESGEELDDLCDNHLSGDAAMGKEGV